jgi:hypothetical protein
MLLVDRFTLKIMHEDCSNKTTAGEHAKVVMVWCFQEQLREYLVEEIHWLVCKWDACLNA